MKQVRSPTRKMKRSTGEPLRLLVTPYSDPYGPRTFRTRKRAAGSGIRSIESIHNSLGCTVWPDSDKLTRHPYASWPTTHAMGRDHGEHESAYKRRAL